VREGVSTVDPELAVHAAVRRIIRASFGCGSCPKKTNLGSRRNDDTDQYKLRSLVVAVLHLQLNSDSQGIWCCSGDASVRW